MNKSCQNKTKIIMRKKITKDKIQINCLNEEYYLRNF